MAVVRRCWAVLVLFLLALTRAPRTVPSGSWSGFHLEVNRIWWHGCWPMACALPSGAGDHREQAGRQWDARRGGLEDCSAGRQHDHGVTDRGNGIRAADPFPDPYDPVKDFAPVSLVANFQMALASVRQRR